MTIQENLKIGSDINDALAKHTTHGKMAGTSYVDTNAALEEAFSLHGARAVLNVIAHHVSTKNDGRISQDNKRWALDTTAGFTLDENVGFLYDNGDKLYIAALDNQHMTVIDGLAKRARQYVAPPEKQPLLGREEEGSDEPRALSEKETWENAGSALPDADSERYDYIWDEPERDDYIGILTGESYQGEFQVGLKQLLDQSRFYEKEIDSLQEQLWAYQNADDDSMKQLEGGALVKTAVAIEDKINELRKKLAEVKRLIIELMKNIANTLKSKGEAALNSLKGDFAKISNGLAELGKGITEARQMKAEALRANIDKSISKGDLVTFNQRLADGSVETSALPRLFASALSRNDKIGCSMADAIHNFAWKNEIGKLPDDESNDPDIISEARFDAFKSLSPASAFDNGIQSHALYSVSWLLNKDELHFSVTLKEKSELVFTAARQGDMVIANALLSKSFDKLTCLDRALHLSLSSNNIESAKNLISLGADIESFTREVATNDLQNHNLDADGRKFMNSLLKYWNDLRESPNLETEAVQDEQEM